MWWSPKLDFSQMIRSHVGVFVFSINHHTSRRHTSTHSSFVAACSVLDVLRSEARVMEGLRSLLVETPFIHDILKLNVQPSDSDYAVDIRNPAIFVRTHVPVSASYLTLKNQQMNFRNLLCMLLLCRKIQPIRLFRCCCLFCHRLLSAQSSLIQSFLFSC